MAHVQCRCICRMWNMKGCPLLWIKQELGWRQSTALVPKLEGDQPIGPATAFFHPQVNKLKNGIFPLSLTLSLSLFLSLSLSLSLSGTFSQAATVKGPPPSAPFVDDFTTKNRWPPSSSSLIKHGLLENSLKFHDFPTQIPSMWGISSLPCSMTPDLQDPNPRNFQVFPLSSGFGGFRASIAFPNKCNRLAHIWHLKATLLQKVEIGQETSHFQWCRSATFPGMFFFDVFFVFLWVKLVVLGNVATPAPQRPQICQSTEANPRISSGVRSLVSQWLFPSQEKLAHPSDHESIPKFGSSRVNPLPWYPNYYHVRHPNDIPTKKKIKKGCSGKPQFTIPLKFNYHLYQTWSNHLSSILNKQLFLGAHPSQ